MTSQPPELDRMHESAVGHVTGRAVFIDDRPFLSHELHVGLVCSPHAHARILGIDARAALDLDGVVCVLTAADLHHHHWGTIFPEQPFLAIDAVRHVGEVVAIIGARTREVLAEAKRAVIVRYEELPAVLSIEAAIAQEHFIGSRRFIARGQVDEALASAPHRLTGQLRIAGAEHFYLENQAAIAYPKEDGQMEVHASTQHPTETQHLVAEALGLKQSDVVCVCLRLGGGFGGKETQAAPFAVYAAIVAQVTACPARIVLSKDEDMIVTGKRNPFLIRYELGFDLAGRILALKAQFYSDGGAYADLSTAIMERALLHADNAYFIPAVHVEGQVCRTHHHPHTAFRGFGGPKGVALIEGLIEEVARRLNMDALDVRKLNCYGSGERAITHYGQTVENNMLPQLFDQLERSCHYRARRLAVDSWNREPQNNPRGLALTAVKFGISFTTRFLNQGNALVNIHRDGSVQVSTGAVEMGQGVHSRIARLVADDLGLGLERVRIMVTSTEKNANTSPTAASSGTDINGAAALDACTAIKKRLSELAYQLTAIAPELWAQKTAGLGTQPEIEVDAAAGRPLCVFSEGLVYPPGQKDKAIPFATLVAEAYFNRISLCDYGTCKIPHLGFNKLSGQGRAFLYYTQGVAASEVEIDRFTGEVKVLRTDILMDLGRPINAALDRGQVAGAFVQGLGWVTSEALVYDAKGRLLTHAPSTYKIPSVHDMPREFSIAFLANPDNQVNVRGTKAVGEPPLMLCFSVWCALRDALRYRLEPRQTLELPIPATAEVLLKALKPELFAAWEGASA